ncbi:MAG: nuclear transport factor 2 family protein [Longimicrobiaceae bacterium]
MTRLPALLLALALGACGSAMAGAPGPAADPTAEILALQDSTARAWNHANLDGHVAPYADTATFMARGPVRGRDRIRASLERSFWREGRPLQQLRYDSLTVRPMGPGHALVTGKFTLYGGGRDDRSGWFSLLYARTAEGWKILHDHSS